MTELTYCIPEGFAVFTYLLGIVTGTGAAAFVIFWLCGLRPGWNA